MDFDQDGDHSLVVVCPDKPFNGTYFFENTEGDVAMPVFEPPVRISKGDHNVQVSYVDGSPRVLSPGIEHTEFYERGIDTGKVLGLSNNDIYTAKGNIRAKQWKYVDYDGDGALDIVAGSATGPIMGGMTPTIAGEMDERTLERIGFLYRNLGTSENPEYDRERQIKAVGRNVEVFGWPSLNLATLMGMATWICVRRISGWLYLLSKYGDSKTTKLCCRATFAIGGISIEDGTTNDRSGSL